MNKQKTYCKQTALVDFATHFADNGYVFADTAAFLAKRRKFVNKVLDVFD